MHGEMREGRIKNRIPMCNFSERVCETAHSGKARNGWMGLGRNEQRRELFRSSQDGSDSK